MQSLFALVSLLLFSLTSTSGRADQYPTAVFSGLDKISATVTQFEVQLGKPARYGSLEVLVRACHKKPPEETPQTSVYVEVREVSVDTGEVDPKPMFKGWMFAESPGINGLEHAVYDIWLNTCKGAASPEPGSNL
jgi:hypothetical protein